MHPLAGAGDIFDRGLFTGDGGDDVLDSGSWNDTRLESLSLVVASRNDVGSSGRRPTPFPHVPRTLSCQR